MAVDSYLELFTTLFGWHWFAGVWGTLASTGLVLVPFIVIFIVTWKDTAKGGNFGNVYELTLRAIEIELYVAVFVAAIAGPPLITLNASVITYDPPATLANPTPTTATPTSSGTTYGNAGAFSGAPTSVKIPLWWYTVLALSKGVNHAIMGAIPDTTSVREIQQQAVLSTIGDAKLRAEAGRFYAECYIPARSKYMREKPTVTNLLNEWGDDDPDWMGSHVYRQLYYPNMRSKNKVVGWPYDPVRDKNFDTNLTHVWGNPTCEQWWADSSNGIRAAIVATPEASTLRNMMASAYTSLASSFSTFTNSAEKLNDKAARTALDNARVASMTRYQPDTLGVYERSGLGENVIGAAQDVAGGVGAGLANFTIGTMLNTLKPMLPIIQSIILMMVYALLPLIIVFSRYSLGMLFTAGIGIFTIHFWTVLWKLAKWADDNLIVAMHPGTFDQLLSSLSSGSGFIGPVTKTFLIDTMMSALMIGMPIIWSMMMTWVGISIGREINRSLSDGSGSSKQSGESGGRLATKGKG